MARKKYQGKFQQNRKPIGARRSRGPLGVWLLLLLTVLSMAGIGTAVAKYLRESSAGNIFHAPEFYFTSNYLSAEGESYVLNSGVSSVTFTLSNSADDLRASECDVNYKVTVTGGAKFTENSGTELSGTWEASAGKQEKNLTINGMEQGKSYTVTATGSNGYSQTLTATFTIAGNEENVYKHLDDSNEGYVLLTVWAHNVAGNVAVGYPAGLIPDNTDTAMASEYNYSNGSYSSGDFTDGASFGSKYSSRTYRFFRSGAEAASVDAFSVMLISGSTNYPAVASNP